MLYTVTRFYLSKDNCQEKTKASNSNMDLTKKPVSMKKVLHSKVLMKPTYFGSVPYPPAYDYIITGLQGPSFSQSRSIGLKSRK